MRPLQSGQTKNNEALGAGRSTYQGEEKSLREIWDRSLMGMLQRTEHLLLLKNNQVQFPVPIWQLTSL